MCLYCRRVVCTKDIEFPFSRFLTAVHFMNDFWNFILFYSLVLFFLSVCLFLFLVVVVKCTTYGNRVATAGSPSVCAAPYFHRFTAFLTLVFFSFSFSLLFKLRSNRCNSLKWFLRPVVRCLGSSCFCLFGVFFFFVCVFNSPPSALVPTLPLAPASGLTQKNGRNPFKLVIVRSFPVVLSLSVHRDVTKKK